MTRRDRLLLLPPAAALGLVLLACGGGGGGGGDAVPPEPSGLEARVPVTGLAFPLSNPVPGALDVRAAYPNLSFTRPVFLAQAPDGTDRVFVAEQGGRIHVFPDDPDVSPTERRLFVDLTDRVSRAGEEEGLLGLAFDPDYAATGRFWVHYSAANPRRSILSRLQVTSDPDAADRDGEVVLLTIPQPYSNHNGGMLAFGPDGMLYVGVGDGGGSGDPQRNGQDLGTLLGKVLRLDVRGPATPYGIPADNPFVGRSGARGEIWAYGARNPWRFSFDRNVGTLWLGDVGQGNREEIDVVPRGANLGWNAYEGFELFAGGSPEAYVPPVRDYPRSEGTCVIGGYVYRGTAAPSLRGAYLHGDYGSGRVWALVDDGLRVVAVPRIATVPGLSSFGEKRDGEVLAVSLQGGIWRFEERDPAPPPAFPARLSETGLFSDTAGLLASPGLVEYDVNAPLWSDGAQKRRWIALPGTSRIGFDPTGPWTFPVGTVLVKHFEVDVAGGGTRRLETRVLLRESAGWAGYAYRWNAAGTDADLLAEADSTTYVVDLPGGGTAERTWRIPSRTDCLRCHTAAAGFALGVRTGQLNRPFDYPLRTANQLATWNAIGLLDRDVGASSGHEAWADPADATLAVEPRARAYLAANCANCHLPAGPTPVDLDLRHATPTGLLRAVDEPVTGPTLGLPDAARIRSGSRSSSVLWERMRRRDEHAMPPLGTEAVDAAGVGLIGEWIDSLGP